jgi:hypothetical protein
MGSEGSWQSEHQFFTDNPKAAEATAKYKTIDDYHKGAYEAMTKVGRPYWLPDDHSKLTDDQKADIRANINKMNGVPDTADGYVINIPQETEVPVEAEAVANLKVFFKENDVSPELAQKIVDIALSDRQKLYDLQKQAKQEQAKEGFKDLSKQLKGDAPAMAAMQQIKEYLQSKCVGDDGKPDPEMWEQFMQRMFFEDKIVDGVLARALLEPARLASEGGSPMGSLSGKEVEGMLSYPEMKQK